MGPLRIKWAVAWLLVAGLEALQTANAASQSQLALQALHGPWWQCGGMDRCPDGKGCLDAPWPESECLDGFECVRENKYYWQCKRKEPVDTWDKPASEAYVAIAGLTVPDAPSPPAAAAAATPPAEQQLKQQPAQPEQQQQQHGQHTVDVGPWVQCGGVSTCTLGKALCGDRQWANCPAGFACVKQDEFYRQCKPVGVFPFPDPFQHPGKTAQKLAQALLDAGLLKNTEEQPAAVEAVVQAPTVVAIPADAAADATDAVPATTLTELLTKSEPSAVQDVPATVEMIKPNVRPAAPRPVAMQQLTLALEYPGISVEEFRQSYSANSLSAVALLTKVPASLITQTITPLGADTPSSSTLAAARIAAPVAAPAAAPVSSPAASAAPGRRLKQQPAVAADAGAMGVKVVYKLSTPTPAIPLARINKAVDNNGDLLYKLLAANDIPIRPGFSVNGKVLLSLQATTPSAAAPGNSTDAVAEAPLQPSPASEPAAPVAAAATTSSSNDRSVPAAAEQQQTKAKHAPGQKQQQQQQQEVATVPPAAPAAAGSTFWTKKNIIAVVAGAFGGILLAALTVFAFVVLRRRAQYAQQDDDDGLSIAEGDVYPQHSQDKLHPAPKYIYYDAGSQVNGHEIQPHYSHSRTSEVNYPAQPDAYSFR